MNERKFKAMVKGWGTFIYTESEIEHDRKRGFVVEVLSEVFT